MHSDAAGSRGDGMFASASSSHQSEQSRKDCVRFKKGTSSDRDFKDAVAYLVLRDAGCPRKDAIISASKNNCRVDTTKSTYGPKEYRKLKVLPTPPYLIENGWLYGSPDLNLGKCFPHRNTASILDSIKDQVLEDNFNSEELKVRKEYLDMISRMKAYVDEVNSKYSLMGCHGAELVQAARGLVLMMKSEMEQRSYLLINSVKFYNIAELILAKSKIDIDTVGDECATATVAYGGEKLNDNSRTTLIDKLNVFRNFENEKDFKNQPIYRYEDEFDKLDDMYDARRNSILFNHKGVCSSSTGLASPTAFRGDISRSPSVYAQGLKSLESAKNLLEEFERNEEDDQPIPKGRLFDRKLQEERKQRSEKMKDQLQSIRQESRSSMLGGGGKSTKTTGVIEEQFNGRMHLFKNDEKFGERLSQQETAEKQQLFDLLLSLLLKEKPVTQKQQLEQLSQQVNDIDTDNVRVLKASQDNCIHAFKNRVNRSAKGSEKLLELRRSLQHPPPQSAKSFSSSLGIPARALASSSSRRNFLSASTISTLANSSSVFNLHERSTLESHHGLFSKGAVKNIEKTLGGGTGRKILRFQPTFEQDNPLQESLTGRLAKRYKEQERMIMRSSSTMKRAQSNHQPFTTPNILQTQSSQQQDSRKVTEISVRSARNSPARALKPMHFTSSVNFLSSTSIAVPKNI